MAIQERAVVADPRWGEYPADEYSDAVVQALKLGDVDYLFFVSGSEMVYFQESIARGRQRGWQVPKLITMTHEAVALHATLGATMVTGKPNATAAHVDVGTINWGAALHNAWRGPYPVMMLAGTAPRAYPGSMPGGRESSIQWLQEPRDQGEIVRQYTKIDHRMEHQDNPGLMVSRLLQVAMSEPKGPVYLSIPRETAMLPLPGTTRFPTRDQMHVASPPWPDPSDARKVAEWLVKADNPAMFLGKSGRNPESVAELVQLAELLAIPATGAERVDRLGFPTTHALFESGPAAKDADVLLVFENVIPWMAPRNLPRADAKIVWVDPDGAQARFKTMEFCADVMMTATTAAAARAIYEAATSLLTTSDMNRIADRRARLERRRQELEAQWEHEAQAAGKRRPIHPRWAAYQLGQIMDPDAILLDDAVSNGGYLDPYHRRAQPGTFFSSGGSGGGWGPGAAFGAKLAKPDRDVFLAAGDGFFIFGEPVSALWSAAHDKAPFLTMVFANRSYSTGTNGLRRVFPEGAAVEAGMYDGGVFDPPPDFAKLAEAVGCYGETVTEPEDVGPALRRGLDQVHKGYPAVVAIWLPTHVEELTLPR